MSAARLTLFACALLLGGCRGRAVPASIKINLPAYDDFFRQTNELLADDAAATDETQRAEVRVRAQALGERAHALLRSSVREIRPARKLLRVRAALREAADRLALIERSAPTPGPPPP